MSEITTPINVVAYIGELEVIGSGTVHVSENQQLNLIIGSLKMKFCFSMDSSIKDTQWTTSVDNDTLTWKLVNFNNSLGQGLLNPVKLGSYNKRELFASFFIWTPNANEGLRIVNYVIYLGQKTNE